MGGWGGAASCVGAKMCKFNDVRVSRIVSLSPDDSVSDSLKVMPPGTSMSKRWICG